MHFGAWRNRGILIYHSINKHWIFRRSLYQSKNVIFPLIATSYNNASKFVIFSDQCLFRNSRRMSTARLAGKTIDDVLYPKIEPYKTGMLKVSQQQKCQWIFQIITNPNLDFLSSSLFIYNLGQPFAHNLLGS